MDGGLGTNSASEEYSATCGAKSEICKINHFQWLCNTTVNLPEQPKSPREIVHDSLHRSRMVERTGRMDGVRLGESHSCTIQRLSSITAGVLRRLRNIMRGGTSQSSRVGEEGVGIGFGRRLARQISSALQPMVLGYDSERPEAAQQLM